MQAHSKHTLLHLSLIIGIGPHIVAALIEHFGTDQLGKVYHCMPSDFMQLGISQISAERLFAGLRDKKALEAELLLLEQHNIQLILLGDAEYPELLRHINLPPTVLYVQGSALALQSALRVAIVGSRAADAYGAACITQIVPELVAHGCHIVSGGALGADTMAHQTAIAAGGCTIAVIGSGLLKPYPLSNRALFADIITHGGAIVSPFPLLMEPLAGNFPARNRIIAGLSAATLVIQAAARSGASITANCALEQGREVGAIPGDINNVLSAGCHRLISQGALLVTCAGDILQALGIATPEEPVLEKVIAPEPRKQSYKPAIRVPKQPLVEQDPLLALCHQAQSYDELLNSTGLAHDILQQRLWELQIDGLLEQNFTGMWQTTRDIIR